MPPKKTAKSKKSTTSPKKAKTAKRVLDDVDSDDSSANTKIARVESKSALAALINAEWRQLLADEFEKPYWASLEAFVSQQYDEDTVFPPRHQIFRAFDATPLSQVKVVIIGQDPYFNPTQAEGFSFSMPRGVKIPPSLRRIHKLLAKTIDGFKVPNHGCLEEWAARGVLMLNASLTVRKGKANSHAKAGWLTFTDQVAQQLAAARPRLAVILWGNFAQKFARHFDDSQHLIICDPHPSPMSGSAFNDTNPFAQANEYLEKHGIDPVDWTITLD